MNFWFEMSINGLEAALILNFLARYFGYRITNRTRYWGTALIWGISFFSVSLFSWTHRYESYASSLQIVINFIFCLWLLRGAVLQKLFVSAFTMGLVAIIATFTALLFGQLLGHEVETLLSSFDPVRIVAVLTSKLLFFLATRIILRFRQSARMDFYDFIPLIIIPAVSIGAITLMMHAALMDTLVQSAMLYAVFLVLILNILTYYLFVRLGRASQMKLDLELLNLQYECTQNNAQDIQNLYEDTRALRHDLKNHMICLSALAGKNKLSEIQEYLGTLLQQQEETSHLVAFSGNDVVDATIRAKQAAAKRAGIRFHVVITDALRFVAPEDLCVLLGNALDNAIAAAACSSKRELSLQIQPQGAYVSICVTNSIAHSVLESNPTLATTKAQAHQHGFGVRNMKKVVEKHDGLMRFLEEDGNFICEILLLKMQSRN